MAIYSDLSVNQHIIPYDGIDEKRKKKKSLFGNDLLSQAVTHQVPSALTSLTSGFEMGPGVSSSLKSPRDFIHSVSDTEQQKIDL